MKLRSQSRPKRQQQQQQEQQKNDTTKSKISLLDLPREVRDLIYEDLVALPEATPTLTTHKRASESQKRKRRASDTSPIDDDDDDDDDDNSKRKSKRKRKRAIPSSSSSAASATDEVLYIHNHSNASMKIDSIRIGGGQLTLSSPGWPALALMLSCKQVAAELRQLFWQPYRIGTAVAAWRCSLSLGDLPVYRGGSAGAGGSSRWQPPKSRVPRFRWHVLSCHPAALRSLVVDLKISGKQFGAPSPGRGGTRDTLWTGLRRSGCRGYMTPGIRMRTLWDLLALVLYRGPRFDSAGLLEEHVRLDDLTIRLVDDGVDTSRQLDPGIFDMRRIARHDACCHGIGHSRIMHEVFNSLAWLIGEGMRRGSFADHVERVTCVLERPDKIYSATHHSGETATGRTRKQLMAKIDFLRLDWRTDRWLVPSSSAQT